MTLFGPHRSSKLAYATHLWRPLVWSLGRTIPTLGDGLEGLGVSQEGQPSIHALSLSGACQCTCMYLPAVDVPVAIVRLYRAGRFKAIQGNTTTKFVRQDVFLMVLQSYSSVFRMHLSWLCLTCAMMLWCVVLYDGSICSVLLMFIGTEIS